ncbi:MAG: flagellar biosynthetic protein FliO [Opitutaceae bacterium]
MTSLSLTPSSVIRWLLVVVVGCAVLETAQPMKAASAADTPRTGETLLYPAGSSSPSAAPARSSSGPGGATWAFMAVAGLGAVSFWVWRRRGRASFLRQGSITIEDTRALGNRQFLVVASCDGRRFLLGVAAGGIQLLSPLDPKEDPDDPNQD